MKDEHVKDVAQDVAQDVAEGVLGAAKDGNAKVLIVAVFFVVGVLEQRKIIRVPIRAHAN